jgi:hypothetical protein
MRFRGILLLPTLLAGISVAQSTNFAAGPQYLITTESSQFLRSIATPSLSLSTPLPPLPSLPQVAPVVTNQPYIANPELEDRANLFPIYYGYPELPAVFLISAATPAPPASLNETGFVTVPTVQFLREHGYGETLAQAAAYRRLHRHAAAHVYTNEDLERLHRR